METPSKERLMILALQALQNDPKLSIRKAAQIYKVSYVTLSRRRKGKHSRAEITVKSRKLSNLEERTIIQRVLKLESQGFPVRISGVEDMANLLRRERDASPVGKNWAENFIRRQPELQTQKTRSYDNQRALCEDPEKIQDWFRLVANFIAKYGICVEDIYNFDETGFLMGILSTTTVVTSSDRTTKPKLVQPGNREWVTVIQGVNSQGWAVPPFLVFKGKWHLASWYEEEHFPAGWRVAVSKNGWTTNELTLEWLKHFEKFTCTKTVGTYRLLVLDGHESHHSAEFEEYCCTNNILTLCMPAHSSHLLQPLDIGCFGPLKKAYSRQIENFVRTGITHISKEAFIPAFIEAFRATITKENIQGGFKGAGLVPYNPEVVISQLDIRLSTPTPENSRPTTSYSWVSKTPQTTKDASSQTTLIKQRIVRHQSSSPTPILDAIDLLTKGTAKVMQENILLRTELERVLKANNELSRRRRTKRQLVQEGGTLDLQEFQELETQTDVQGQILKEERQNRGRKRQGESHDRRCRGCGKTGHNKRTCQADRAALYNSNDLL
jgi:DDE superfamily endonuclease/helix-turn-helix, Psq domain